MKYFHFIYYNTKLGEENIPELVKEYWKITGIKKKQKGKLKLKIICKI